MNFFLSSISSILHYSPIGLQPFESSVANLSTRDRESLVHDIALEIDHEDVESSLAGLEVTLSECKTSLEAFEKKERFVGVRINRYRMLMDRREERMRELMDDRSQQQSSHSNNKTDDSSSENEDDDDLENKNLHNLREQLDTLQAKHTIDQKRLQSVEELHKIFIVQIEILRRRINDLEEKQENIMVKRDECQDFLIAAAEFT